MKKEITPRGDGNQTMGLAGGEFAKVKKEITPRGDGNGFQYLHRRSRYASEKRDNPERGRKHFCIAFVKSLVRVKKEITPRGDGNF